METTKRKETEQAMQELGAAVQAGEAALAAGGADLKRDHYDVWTRLHAALDQTRYSWERLRAKTSPAVKATDQTVREHPYQSAGVAFGVGLLIGVLAGRCRNRD